MDSLKQLLRRDASDSDYDAYYGPSMGPLVMVFFGLILAGSVLSLVLVCLRRKRIAQRQALLPQYRAHSHHRSASVTNLPNLGRNESVYVYDEKMNLIANSANPSSTAVPQIRVTFPDDNESSSQPRPGRVVVVHVTDSGSVGMSPLSQEPAPPYQRADAERFQSLDLDRMGGLREKEGNQQRYS
ncbi:uncharacterized protein HMPREF1541_05170 [Cyphellophora europaea CBS 101466]|uniref:Uncharacterized protein n=1 Tax=Cyphellophora europaea (strain CBS 101466) TaxID=1220924 RepID=W2RX67_CYPE1|nr:uncharacterized protein HMPREF1541_05170 [Cyphellophora europaea CBS 101466]ETN40890.1 hypothetical protein HMPREF1541_05170 [Cyphellophora europaea CBS 101466]